MKWFILSKNYDIPRFLLYTRGTDNEDWFILQICGLVCDTNVSFPFYIRPELEIYGNGDRETILIGEDYA
jgi:hypothetical protein